MGGLLLLVFFGLKGFSSLFISFFFFFFFFFFVKGEGFFLILSFLSKRERVMSIKKKEGNWFLTRIKGTTKTKRGAVIPQNPTVRSRHLALRLPFYRLVAQVCDGNCPRAFGWIFFFFFGFADFVLGAKGWIYLYCWGIGKMVV